MDNNRHRVKGTWLENGVLNTLGKILFIETNEILYHTHTRIQMHIAQIGKSELDYASLHNGIKDFIRFHIIKVFIPL